MCKIQRFEAVDHGIQIFERVLYNRQKHVTKVNENQFVFLAGKSTTGAIFIIQQLQEKYLEIKVVPHICGLEKALDKVPRPAIRWALHRQVVPESLIYLVRALYSETESRVRVAGETSDKFEIGVGVHQGSVLSHLLFILVMEEATSECRVLGLWDLLYGHDLAQTAETLGEVKLMFGEWRHPLERRGLKVNFKKIKMVTRGEMEDVFQVGRYPCGVCGHGVGANSVLCRTCGGVQVIGGVQV